ncbi:hypothetical protein K4F52_009044 [Lecanicillium sp. MT-2017a]|nr:hypothetical protein K4F52_009044 [Lecanicillium sp. MT-2017a]
MPPRQQTGASFAVVLLLIWLLMPAGEIVGQTGPLISDLIAIRLRKFNDALGVLNTTAWNDFRPTATEDGTTPSKYINLTGFREVDGFAWEDFERFRARGLELSRHAVPPVRGRQLWDLAEGEHMWRNASGTLRGDWVYQPASVKRTHESYNLSNSVPSMDWIGDKVEWARNITGKSGHMHLRLEGNRTITSYKQLPVEQAPLSGGQIRNIKGSLSLEDTTGSGHTWDMRLWGVHWPRQGVILMTTTSEKFDGIFGLPHLTPSADYFHSSKNFLSERLGAVLEHKEKNIYMEQSVPWSSDVENNPQFLPSPAPQCEYILYAQVYPPDRQSISLGSRNPDELDMESIIEAIEAELETPRGAPVGRIPKLQMSAVVYSPDCAFFLETKGAPNFPPSEAQHLTGIKAEVQTHRVKTWLLVFACVVFVQVYLLKNQMKETFTPSTMGRVSFWTITFMVMVDGMTFTASATWVSNAGATFLPTLALMFAAFLSMTIGGSFLAKVYEVQFPENRRAEAETSSQGANTPALAQQPPLAQINTGSILPAPVTASARVGQAPSPPVIVPLDGDVDAEIADGAAAVPGLPRANVATAPQPTARQSFQAIIGRFILSSLCISFITLSSSTWYPAARAFYLNLCAFVYLSLWTPQIYRNVMRNCRRALTWQFVIGQSLLRLMPIAYFWVKVDNFLFAQPDRFAFACLCGWLWLQVFILGAQDAVGPRFAVPVAWTPEAWDYHPVLREDNVEAGGLPIGLVAVSELSEQQQARRRNSRGSGTASEKAAAKNSLHAIDCSICQEVLEVPVIGSGGDEEMGVASVFARRMYMVTPCRHIFHTACLESWMKFRLQCPICREDLPPL